MPWEGESWGGREERQVFRWVALKVRPQLSLRACGRGYPRASSQIPGETLWPV